MKQQSRPSPRQSRPVPGFLVTLLLATLLASACAVPGPTPTISSDAKTAVAVRPAEPTPTGSSRPTSATPVPSRAATATEKAARPAQAPKPSGWTATESTPCRPLSTRSKPIPDRKSTVDNVGQAYQCLLKHYVDRKALDHRVLLTGAWEALAASGVTFDPADRAPLDFTGDREADWQVFAARFSALSAKYGKSVETSALARLAVNGMATSLRDNHVYYLEPKEWRRNYAAELGVRIVPTAGFEPVLDEATGKFFLYTIVPNGPAAKAGLRPGDIIETVGGHATGQGQNNRALGDLLGAPLGTGTMVQVRRPATGETIRVLVKVEEVEVSNLEARVLPGGIGYIRLHHFSFYSGEDFAYAVRQLKARGIKGLIFDVRQNPGGSAAALVEIMSHLTHQGPIAVAIDEDGNRENIDPDPTIPLLDLPWTVLIDGGSASSADVTAAVARGRGGHLVGVTSAGALGGAQYFELEDGSALGITVYRVLGPDGEDINEIGVKPHHTVPLTPADLSAGIDSQLDHALKEMTGR